MAQNAAQVERCRRLSTSSTRSDSAPKKGERGRSKGPSQPPTRPTDSTAKKSERRGQSPSPTGPPQTDASLWVKHNPWLGQRSRSSSVVSNRDTSPGPGTSDNKTGIDPAGADPGKNVPGRGKRWKKRIVCPPELENQPGVLHVNNYRMTDFKRKTDAVLRPLGCGLNHSDVSIHTEEPYKLPNGAVDSGIAAWRTSGDEPGPGINIGTQPGQPPNDGCVPVSRHTVKTKKNMGQLVDMINDTAEESRWERSGYSVVTNSCNDWSRVCARRAHPEGKEPPNNDRPARAVAAITSQKKASDPSLG